MRKLEDNRLTKKVMECWKTKQITYTVIAEKLKVKGYDVEARDVYEIACKRKKVSKEMQHAIADILGCLRKDIF